MNWAESCRLANSSCIRLGNYRRVYTRLSCRS